MEQYNSSVAGGLVKALLYDLTTKITILHYTTNHKNMQVLPQPMGTTNNRIHEFKEDYENG